MQEQQDEIETLNATVADCLESVSDISNQLESAENDITSLQTQLKASEQELLESRNAANIFKRITESRIARLEKEICSYRHDLKEARDRVSKQSYLVESFQTEMKTQLKNVATTEAKLAEETARNVTILKESKNVALKDAETIEKLTAKNEELLKELHMVKQESASQRTKLQESVTKNKESNEKTATVLNGYLRKCCEANGIDVEAVKAHLPASFTMKDVDNIVTELADRQARFDMLPLTLAPIHGRVVEHNASYSEKQSSSFVVEALKRGQKTTN